MKKKKKKKKKKTHTVPNVCQNRIPYRTEKAKIAHFMKKSMHLKTGFLLDYQVLSLLQNGPRIENSSLIVRFMTAEASNTFIVPFISKTGRYVAQNRQMI